MNLFRTLKAEEIECRVSKVYDWGVSVLLYKTARTDMDLLDEVFGAENWESDYKEIKGNLFCGIGVYNAQRNEWTWKWDCGIESREDNGNEKKGEASDAMKRAGFKWGIGRELYTAPRIIIKCKTKEGDKTISHYFNVKTIEYDDQRRISKIEITENDSVVYTFGKDKPVETPKTKPVEIPKTSADMLKVQLVALADNDVDRLNVFIGKLFKDESLNIDNLNQTQLEKAKVALAQVRNKK